ncbi:iron ABC transporter substrate-binding protein [Hyphomicrobium sp. DY-1]|uniref:iron ABC transporter substrate-binding protein n=1 Tax=Hyphomicrobium sp. DY-1 TaxID=3075650 RepID=UPI0039C49961
MAISKTAGSKIYISPVSVDPGNYNGVNDAAALALFEAIADWVEVEEVEDLGEHGDTAEEITFTSVSDARTRKQKGARNAGTKTIVVGVDPLDEGQVALADAQATDFNYAFKIVRNDARSASYTNTVEYFIGLVTGEAVNQGAQNNIVRQTFPISINTKIYRVLSALIESP